MPADDSDARVECYSGYQADERPLRFSAGGREYIVAQVLDRWYGPDEAGFRVRCEDGGVWVLRRARDGRWTASA